MQQLPGGTVREGQGSQHGPGAHSPTLACQYYFLPTVIPGLSWPQLDCGFSLGCAFLREAGLLPTLYGLRLRLCLPSPIPVSPAPKSFPMFTCLEWNRAGGPIYKGLCSIMSCGTVPSEYGRHLSLWTVEPVHMCQTK